MKLNNLVEKRRTIYNIGNKKVLPENEIIELVEHSIKHCPTAFNSQSSRTVILFGDNHKKLWDIAFEELKPLTPPDRLPITKGKIESFKAGYGTILYYEDQDTVQNLQQKFPTYKDHFAMWSSQANAMLEYIIWTTLSNKNLGASLQHYNPLIDAKCAKEWNIPSSWKLIAQMPFGSIEGPADPKDFLPINMRLKVFK